MDFTEVTGDNIYGLVDPILNLVRRALYIAVDTEFSGHGPLVAKHMDQRYQDLSHVIKTHTLFSFGLTIITPGQQQHSTSYNFTNFEFLLRNQQSFQMDPQNIKFLAENGLDFGNIFQHGIPYTSGTTNKENDVLRQLWHDILKITKERHISFIVHNGLLDIMYLYQSFIASLPDKLPHFIADVVEMFPAGIYDTKYLATELLNEHKSYLAYLYCKYRRLSLVSSSWSVLAPLSPVLVPSTTHEIESSCQSLNDMTPSMKRRKRMKKQEKNKESKTGICGLYANRGWCKKGKECDLSHDLQIILDHDLGTIQTNKDLNEQPLPGTSTNHNDSLPPPSTDIERRDHSAHFDAYMTAFVFCHFLSTVPLEDLSSHVNKLNLMRMDLPLRLVESHYAKPSTEWIRIKSLLWP